MSGSTPSETAQYVLFGLRGEDYGLPVEAVRSVMRYERPTPVPYSPEGIEGVLNLRGQILPVVDLGRQLHGTALEPTPLTRIIVAEGRLGPMGLAVDKVYEVARIPVKEVKAPPPTMSAAPMGDAVQGVAAIGDRLVVLLDPNNVLPKPLHASIDALQEGDRDA